MADRRRRRALEDEGEESVSSSQVTDGKGRPSECESEGEAADGDIASEYESAAEESHDAGGEEEEEEESEEGSEEEETEEETEEGSENEYTDEDVIVEEEEEQIAEERQSGDGEEQPDKEHVDDDEDKKNPAYVPRKGAFYEHDLRTGEEATQEPELKPKKKLWQDEGKWVHDRYRDEMQAPKSREELIALYGYDIRSSDKPPDAPPLRKSSNRGRRQPQRRAKLEEYIEPQQTQRFAVIDTSDNRRKSRGKPKQQGYDGYEDDIDVPYMATIDTTESSANQFRHKNQHYRGGLGPRKDHMAFGDKSGSRQGGRSQEGAPKEERFSYPRDSRKPRFQDVHPKDIPAQEFRTRDAQGRDQPQDIRLQEKWGHDDYRIKNSYRKEDRDDNSTQYHNHGNNFVGKQGSGRGGVSNRMPIRDRKNRGFSQSDTVRDLQPSNSDHSSGEVVSNLREFTNSTYKSTAVQEGAKSMQVDVTGPAGARGTQTSQDVVISNKENVQTISVTITNTTTERKSYAKERHGKGGGTGRVGLGLSAGEEVGTVSGHRGGSESNTPEAGQTSNTQGSGDQKPAGSTFASGSKQDMREPTRPKRYSSQRQRSMPETVYPGTPPQQGPVDTGTKYYNQAVYPPAPPAAFFHPEAHPPIPQHPPPSQDPGAFSPAMLQPPLPFHLPVSGPGMPSPPRLFAPPASGTPPVPISSASPTLLPTPYLAAAGVIYSAPAPPPVAPTAYQVPLAYTSSPPTAPPPAALTQPPLATLTQPPLATPQSQSEVYRGGTTYYPPHLQQPSARSPARRPRVAIPIVDPQELKKKIANGSGDRRREDSNMQESLMNEQNTAPHLTQPGPHVSTQLVLSKTVPVVSVAENGDNAAIHSEQGNPETSPSTPSTISAEPKTDCLPFVSSVPATVSDIGDTQSVENVTSATAVDQTL